MKTLIHLPVFYAVLVCSIWVEQTAGADVIIFTHGATKKCVILKEDDKWVTYLTSFGEIKTPRARIKSIERESEEVNRSLKEQWRQEQPRALEEQAPAVTEEPAKAPVAARKYTIDVKRRRIMLGGRNPELTSNESVASFVIKDLGMVEGNRLFHVSVISYKTVPIQLTPAAFHALSANGLRNDPRPLKDYPDLKARLSQNQSASGHVSFPTDAELQKLVHKSELAEFELDLETGEFVVKEGPF
jgi:hypothetical protein